MQNYVKYDIKWNRSFFISLYEVTVNLSKTFKGGIIMVDYLLTEETRKHLTGEIKRMLPLVKVTLDDWKQLLKDNKRLSTYETHKNEVTSNVETIKFLVQNGVFPTNKSEDEMIQKRIKELEDELKRTEEFISVLEESTDELENKVMYYKSYFQSIIALAYDTKKPILDKEDVDNNYFREYCYLIFGGPRLKKEELLTDQAIEQIEDVLRKKDVLDKRKVIWWEKRKEYTIREFLEIFD